MQEREIALDTETTGLDPAQGHRIVEIGCVEMAGRIRTGEVFHVYLNPDRDMPDEAFQVHGLSAEFLADKPRFADMAEGFLSFIGDSPLVIHNAAFDLRFLNAELERMGRDPIGDHRAVDTVAIARQMFPGSPASLDALCKRYEIDLSARTKHGALLDAELLAEVYLELTGGRQSALLLDDNDGYEMATKYLDREKLEPRAVRLFPPSTEELAAHTAFIQKLKEPVWRDWLEG